MSDAMLERRLDWMDRGTEFFMAQLAAVSDDQLAGPSRLPGWTRLHVVSHIARNARALMNLLRWAETGVESPMYPSPEARAADIEEGSKLPADEVRADAIDTVDRLRNAISALPLPAWGAEVRTTLGLVAPATDIPWMRAREVWVHAVDLGSGATFDDIDGAVAAALVAEAVARGAEATDCPSVVLVATGAESTTSVMGPPSDEPLRVSGTIQQIAGWLLGRTSGANLESPAPLPDPPPWF
jgi:maleylpyruvate isomerase